jgi:hypothetical protein
MPLASECHAKIATYHLKNVRKRLFRRKVWSLVEARTPDHSGNDLAPQRARALVKPQHKGFRTGDLADVQQESAVGKGGESSFDQRGLTTRSVTSKSGANRNA